ncbi:MAG: TetR/AcrR family transcriptional regulator [Treponema sp.]|jgi:AcrR family transcriptional regulator|nr:TetR/AcrR family transcriptional regulator [Treponema sp.]
MAIIVEHEKRRAEILERALDVFIDDGFADTTFQKIADRCGLTRTSLYRYFHNKTEIFNFSIKYLLDGIEHEIRRIRGSGEGSAGKLSAILCGTLRWLEENRRILAVVMQYLMLIARGGRDPGPRLRRRTIRLRHFFASTVIEGIRSGEFAAVNVHDADDMLFSILEAAAFKLVVLRQDSVDELKRGALIAVNGLKNTAPA